jgi:hypothetical protein
VEALEPPAWKMTLQAVRRNGMTRSAVIGRVWQRHDRLCRQRRAGGYQRGRCLTGIKLEDKVNRQAEAMKAQQTRIEDLTGRAIRLEAQLELLAGTTLGKRLKGG